MKTKKFLVYAVVLMCSMMLLVACKGKTKKNNGMVTYKVTVADAVGNPYTSGVIVKFMLNGNQEAMQVCDANGVATKELKAGDYTIELAFTDKEADYSYEKDFKVTADKPEVTVVLALSLSEESTSLYVGDKVYDAYRVSAGCTNIELEDGKNYFLFTPTEAGMYEFSIVDGTVGGCGYYGSPYYVQHQSIVEVNDNKFKISVSASMIGEDYTGTTVLVVGIDKGTDSNCVLAIERVGEPEYTIADEPWTIYQKTSVISKYTLPAGVNIAEFDLTADAYNVVYNETDGFYHLNSADGPLVLVRLATDSKYLACFKTILENSGVVKYFYDDEGNFVKKEDYATCLLEYIEYVDEKSGTYPLTKDLQYIIQQRGDHEGWWNPDGHTYIFKDSDGMKVPGINHDIAWLFMCCYIAE